MSNSNAANTASKIVIGPPTSAGGSSGFVFPQPAPWLADIQRRLINSVGVTSEAAPEGQWLTASVVAAANSFFQATSDIFPAEPHLQSSLQGKLVAEFRGQFAPLTVIVSDASVLAMAIVDGESVQSTVPLTGGFQPAVWRAEMTKLTKKLRESQHGQVDAG